MRELWLHIEYLLRQTDCVIIPGLGAMIAVSESARIDEETMTLIPPRRRISFNSTLKEDDGLLAHSVARREGISFEEGRIRAKAMTDDFIRTLRCAGESEAGTFGRFALTDGGTLLFRLRYGVTELSDVTGTPELCLSDSAVAMSESMTEEMEERKRARRDDGRYHFSISRRALGIAASISVILIIGLSIIFSVPETGIWKEDKASVLPVESIAREVSRISYNAVAETEKRDTQDVTDEGPVHYLIVGTFSSEKEASDFIAQRGEETGNLEIVKGKGKVWRVSAECSYDRSEVQKMLNSPDFRERWQSGWIWTSE